MRVINKSCEFNETRRMYRIQIAVSFYISYACNHFSRSIQLPYLRKHSRKSITISIYIEPSIDLNDCVNLIDCHS